MDLRIKEIMNERNVTSAWLAEQVGISKVAVSNIVTGKSSPSLDNLIKISGVLNISITELIGEEKEESTITCPHCGKKIKIEKGYEKEVCNQKNYDWQRILVFV